MSKKKKLIGTIIFNIVETILIFIVGSLLRLPTSSVLTVMLTFMITRGIFGKALHFKNWYRCLFWSLSILASLFLVLYMNIVVSIIFTVFSAFIMTGKSNIKDMYLWNNEPNKPGKYDDIAEYIKYHEFDDDLIDFENKLKNKDNLTYLVYKYRFKEKKSFKEISELLDLDNPRIVDKLNNIAFSIRLYCKI